MTLQSNREIQQSIRARILIVILYAPYPRQINGAATRFCPIIDYLAARHDVQVVYISSEPDQPIVDDAPAWVHSMKVVRERRRQEVELWRVARVAAASVLELGPPWLLKNYDIDSVRRQMVGIIDEFKPEVVLWTMAGHALASAVRRARPGPRWFFDFCDSSSLASFRRGRRPRSVAQVRAFEQKLVRAAAGSCFISETDAAFVLAGEQSDKVVVLPNGLEFPDARELCDPPETETRAELGFIGHMGYGPNVDAVLRLRRIHSSLEATRLGIRLKVIGTSPAPEILAIASDTVSITGMVANKWRAMAQVEIFVFPIELGGGLQNKLLEAWALAKPVVASPIVAEPAGAVDGVHVLIARTEEEYVAAVARLLDDPALARRLGEAGRRYVQERFDWAKILPRYEQALLGSTHVDRPAEVGVRG